MSSRASRSVTVTVTVNETCCCSAGSFPVAPGRFTFVSSKGREDTLAWTKIPRCIRRPKPAASRSRVSNKNEILDSAARPAPNGRRHNSLCPPAPHARVREIARSPLRRPPPPSRLILFYYEIYLTAPTLRANPESCSYHKRQSCNTLRHLFFFCIILIFFFRRHFRLNQRVCPTGSHACQERRRDPRENRSRVRTAFAVFFSRASLPVGTTSFSNRK